MPFKKTGKGDYVSPSGKHFTASQVRLYYAHGGRFPGENHKKAKSKRRKLSAPRKRG